MSSGAVGDGSSAPVGLRGERGAGGDERGDRERDEGPAHRTWLIAGSVDESGSSSTGAKVMSSKRAK